MGRGERSRQHPGQAEELSCDRDPVQGTLRGGVSVRKGEWGLAGKALTFHHTCPLIELAMYVVDLSAT